MAMVKQMLKSQSFKQCRLCCFVFLSSANIFVVPFLGKCLDIAKCNHMALFVLAVNKGLGKAADKINAFLYNTIKNAEGGEKKLRKTRVFLSFVFSLKPLIIQLLCDTTTLIPCVLVWLQGYAL